MAVPKSYFLGGVSVAAWTCEHRSLSYNKRRSSTGRVAFGNRIASSTSNGKKRKKKSFFFLVEEKGTKRKFILTFILLKVCCVELLFPGISPPLDDYVYWSWAFFSFLYTLVNQESSTQTLTAWKKQQGDRYTSSDIDSRHFLYMSAPTRPSFLSFSCWGRGGGRELSSFPPWTFAGDYYIVQHLESIWHLIKCNGKEVVHSNNNGCD